MSSTSQPLIAHAVHRFDVGGMENGIVNLINGLPEPFARHAVIAFTDISENFARRIRRPGVELIALHKPPGQTARILPRLWKILRRLKPQVFHTRNLATLEGQAAAWMAGVPVRVHGEHGWDMSDLDGSNTRMLMLRRWLRPLVHHQIALSTPTQNYLSSRVGVSARQISNICNGVDTQRFAPLHDKSSLRQRLSGSHLPEQAFVVGAVGRFAEVKNLPMLVEAFAKVRARNPMFAVHARLALIGDGPQEALLRDQITQGRISSITWMPGARDDVPDCLRAMDMLALPSLAEGISNAILEAMASGLPVVATDVGGNAELVVNGQTGFLIPSGDAAALADRIEQYFTDATMLVRHSAAGRERAVTQFSIQGMVDRYHAVYANLMARRN